MCYKCIAAAFSFKATFAIYCQGNTIWWLHQSLLQSQVVFNYQVTLCWSYTLILSSSCLLYVELSQKKMNSCSAVIIMMIFIIIMTVCVGCSGVCSVYLSVHVEQSDGQKRILWFLNSVFFSIRFHFIFSVTLDWNTQCQSIVFNASGQLMDTRRSLDCFRWITVATMSLDNRLFTTCVCVWLKNML